LAGRRRRGKCQNPEAEVRIDRKTPAGGTLRHRANHIRTKCPEGGGPNNVSGIKDIRRRESAHKQKDGLEEGRFLTN